MDALEAYRNRLDALDAGGAQSLEACRAARERLRELKREILARLFEVRAHIHRQTKRSMGPKPTLGELWDRRDEGARALLEDVRLRVTGLLDDEDGAAAVEAWAGLNREIDARLDRLEELERTLSGGAGEPATAAVPRPTAQPASDRRDTEDDDLYAAVGAAVRKGTEAGAFCSHCRQPIDAEDRFCRRCGHRLG